MSPPKFDFFSMVALVNIHWTAMNIGELGISVLWRIGNIAMICLCLVWGGSCTCDTHVTYSMAGTLPHLRHIRQRRLAGPVSKCSCVSLPIL